MELAQWYDWALIFNGGVSVINFWMLKALLKRKRDSA